jgi:hypothetical protein
MAKEPNITNPSEEQIQKWKDQYGQVYLIEVAEDPESFEANTIPMELDELPKLQGWLKKPDRVILNYALVNMSKNMINAGKSIMNGCWLGGDERLLNGDGHSTAAALQAVDLIEIYQSKLKKL